MRKVFGVLLAVLLSIAMSSCSVSSSSDVALGTKKISVLKRIDSYQSDELYAYFVYEYDEKGNQTARIGYMDDQECYRNDYEYEEGSLISESVSGIYVSNPYMVEYEYNDENQLVFSKKYTESQVLEEISYTYDDRGNIKSEITKDSYGNEINVSYTNVYDDDGKLTFSCYEKVYIPDYYETAVSIYYTYGNDGCLEAVAEETDFIRPVSMTTAETTVQDVEVGTAATTTTYSYDEKGQKTEENVSYREVIMGTQTSSVDENTAASNPYVWSYPDEYDQTYEYDEDGNTLASERIYTGDYVGEKEKYIYEYMEIQ
ncbi:MAG: hypothetical protein PUB22_09195 [Clostridiales bacterium]|nr:hypothetical protein [Clostridiales bacterium]